eukprot:172404-Pyramimonas_sp.AAC.1
MGKEPSGLTVEGLLVELNNGGAMQDLREMQKAAGMGHPEPDDEDDEEVAPPSDFMLNEKKFWDEIAKTGFAVKTAATKGSPIGGCWRRVVNATGKDGNPVQLKIDYDKCDGPKQKEAFRKQWAIDEHAKFSK